MPLPADPTRLAALAEAGVLDPTPNEVFDRLTRLAVRLVGAESSTMILLDEDRHFIKSAAGCNAPTLGPTPESHSPCRDVAAAGHPLATSAGPSHVGVPLLTGDGVKLGALCVCDSRPREWSADEIAALADLGALAVAEIEWRRSRTRQMQAQAALQATEREFRALVEQSLAGIFVVENQRFRYANPKLAEMFGRTPEWLEGRSVWEVIHADDRGTDMYAEARGQIYGEPGQSDFPLRGERADGETLLLEIHATRTEFDGRPAAIGIVLDVTARVRAEEERASAVAARERFFAMVSHELRTPVSAMMLYNELLLSSVYGVLGADQRDAVERSQRCAGELLDLINDLLDLSKLEAGKMEARFEEVELGELVDSVVAGAREMARDGACELRVKIAERPVWVTGDGRRIRQILLNLLSNALKYGPGHPVTVAVEPGASEVVIEVRDGGPGIAAADLSRIFDDFVQLGDSPAAGTGLGLPIARRLAQLLGGSLEAASEPGAGSTFRLQIPR
ncbi:MAG TPA: ATP-binding protein [Longimicrobium sp.]|nr:ATP-binding protein [Longimicrobium sp.]